MVKKSQLAGGRPAGYLQARPRKQLQLAIRAGLEPGTIGFQVRRPNHSITLPPNERKRKTLSFLEAGSLCSIHKETKLLHIKQLVSHLAKTKTKRSPYVEI